MDFLDKEVKVKKELGTHAGLVVGTKGATIQSISNKTGAKVKVNNGVAHISGLLENVKAAEVEIDAIIANATKARQDRKKEKRARRQEKRQKEKERIQANQGSSTSKEHKQKGKKGTNNEVKWFWQDDSGCWNRYPISLEVYLEHWDKHHKPGQLSAIALMNFTVEGNAYQVVRDDGHGGLYFQTNLETRKQRAVKRTSMNNITDLLYQSTCQVP